MESTVSNCPEPFPCIECGRRPALTTGRTVYPLRPHLWDLHIWRCHCGAYVGCHSGTLEPLGRPAGPATRRARSYAHRLFDEYWQRRARQSRLSRNATREAAYQFLSVRMGLHPAETHFAMFNAEQCNRAVAILEE